MVSEGGGREGCGVMEGGGSSTGYSHIQESVGH